MCAWGLATHKALAYADADDPCLGEALGGKLRCRLGRTQAVSRVFELALGGCAVSTRHAELSQQLRRAPDFTLPDDQGKLRSLEQLLARGRAVLVFYRGHW